MVDDRWPIVKESFTCDSSGLVYCISCRRCPAIYIGETGRTLKERFGEHLRSITKCAPGFPVAENSHGHCLDDAQVRGVKLCDGNKQRKRHEMRLIFQLGTWQPRGLNSDFRFCWCPRARACPRQSLHSKLRCLCGVAISNCHSIDEGLCPKRFLYL